MLEAMRIPILEYPGFEADDVIGTHRHAAPGPMSDVVIVSSDKDMLQLVNDRVTMYNPMKDDIWYDPAKVEEFMGVKPGQVADLLALKGDAIDNIPGAPGIGDKGAQRPDRSLRLGGGSARTCRRSRAQDVPRKPAEQSRADPHEQEAGDHRHATSRSSSRSRTVKAQTPDLDALKPVYKEMEFFSLLKELGPTEDARTRDYQRRRSAAAWTHGSRRMPADAPRRRRVRSRARATRAGDDRLRRPHRRRRAASLGHGAERQRPWLQDCVEPAEDRARRQDRRLALDDWASTARGFRHDVMLYAFLLCADPSGCSAETLAEQLLDRKLGAAPEAGAEATLELYEQLAPEIDEAEACGSCTRPSICRSPSCWPAWSATGIRIDPASLQLLSRPHGQEIQRLAARDLRSSPGKQFNINSPQQLGKVLFEDLKLPAPVKYGKGKQISTAADVLEELAAEHEIARKVLDYRQLTKLKGTYVDALPA